MAPPGHFDDPVNLNDPLFFHPQHPRSVENFGEIGFGGPGAVEKSHGIPQRLFPGYQLPGLSYEMRPDGSMVVGARRGFSAPNKRAMDAVPQEGAASAVPNKKRRLTDPAN